MKKLHLLLFCTSLCFLFFSCKKQEKPETIDPETNDPVYMKLKIPKQHKGVSAVYGDIDHTLIVALFYQIYMTTDQGESWQQVYSTSSGVSGFAQYKDELMALGTFSEHAKAPFLFSNDNGKTWSTKGKYGYQIYDGIMTPISKVSVNAGIVFGIDYRRETQIGSLPQPDILYRSDSGTRSNLYFPSQRRLNCIYLDKKNRLYVGADGARFEYAVKGNNRVYPSDADTALLYVSRQPADQLK